MSASAVVHRGEVLERLQELRALLPTVVGQADAVVADRDGVLAEARAEAESVRAQAQEERARLVEQTGVMRQARTDAERLLEQARAQADAMRAEVEDYVDGKLANFEVVLSKTLAAVQRGRSRLSGSSELDELRG
jgi:cell division septum initiation protein DivIVA